MKNPERAREMGQRGREAVIKKFLITRLLLDYLDILASIVG